MSGQNVTTKLHPPGYAGQLVGKGHRVRSYINDLGSNLETSHFTLGSFGFDNGLYEYRVNGFTVSRVSPVGETEVNGVANLAAEHNSNPDLTDLILAAAAPNSTTFQLKALRPDTQIQFTGITFNFTALPGLNSQFVSPQEIPFGRAVVFRTGGRDASATLPTAGGQKFLGVTARIHSDVNPLNPLGSVGSFKKMSVLTHGLIMVETEEAISAGDNVFFRHTAKTGFTDLGVFRNDADTARAAQITGAKFETSTTGAGIAIISLRGA